MNLKTWLLSSETSFNGGYKIIFNLMISKKMQSDCKGGPNLLCLLEFMSLPWNFAVPPTLAPRLVMWLPVTNEILAKHKASRCLQDPQVIWLFFVLAPDPLPWCSRADLLENVICGTILSCLSHPSIPSYNAQPEWTSTAKTRKMAQSKSLIHRFMN